MTAIRPPACRPALLALLILFGPLLTALPARAELTCGDIPDLTTIFFQKHIRFHELGDDLKERTVDTFLRRIDPQRVLFLQADIDGLSKSLMGLFRESRSGNCSRLRETQERVVARHQQNENFVRAFLSDESYAVDPNVDLVIDPEKRTHPVDKKQQDARLRTLVHFQISNYMAGDSDLADAKQRLIHRYELQTMRAKEMTRSDLYGSFLDAFANSLDPHSSYLTADVLEDFQIQMQLSLEGIGVALSERDGYSVVEQIIPGGAADRLDVLQPKDKIIAVSEDGGEPVDVIDMALRDVVRLIRGKKGTRVHLTVLRQTDKTERFHVAILRDKIDLEEQAAKLRFETVGEGDEALKLAVLELPSFYGDRDPTKRKGSRDVRRLLAQVKEENADGLLLDLSRNGGGLLDDAVRISGFFIREGGVVAVQEGKERRRVIPDPDDRVIYGGPMVVLTSRISASASEILAGALKDYRRAVIVGDDHTFGKGTVQSVFPLRPGLGALKVTTALFYRPGGVSTQHGGVNADVVIPSLFNTDAFGERTQRYSLPSQSTDPFVSDKANYSDGDQRWTPISDPVMAEMARRSQARIGDDEFFQKIAEQLAERREDDGVVNLAELIAEREEAKTASAETTEIGSTTEDTAGAAVPKAALDEDDDEPSPHVEEALQVLADLVRLTS